MKEYWIEAAKHVLIHNQLRDNLEKAIVVVDYDDSERRILLKPNPPCHQIWKKENYLALS